MKLTKLIEILQDAYKNNGNMNVAIIVDASIREDVEINCTDDTLYMEGYYK